MKENNNTSIYSNYKIIYNTPMIVTVLPTNKSGYLIKATSSAHITTTTTTTTNNNNNKYFLKLRGISQGDPMEGFPQYTGDIEKNDERVQCRSPCQNSYSFR
jgi:hypothetical protein